MTSPVTARGRLWALPGIVVACVLALAACVAPQSASNTTLQQPYFNAYTQQMLNYAAKKGGMPVLVAGNPFPQSMEQVATTVTSQIEGAQTGPRMPFFAGVPEGFRSPYKLIVVLGPAINASPGRACSKPADQTGGAASDVPRSLTALMVFCNGDRRVSSIIGTINGVGGLENPGFRQFLRAMTSQILPIRDPNRTGGDRDADFF